MTGMSPALLRAWEARYGLVIPERTESGYRLYSDEDVNLFLGAQRLVQQGMAPMQVARLPRSKLLEAGSRLSPRAEPASEAPAERSYSELVERVIAAIAEFDIERTEELVTLPILLMKPEAACRKILVPLMHEIGRRWHRGELPIAAEHFGTALVRNKLLVLLDTLRTRTAERRVLCACPPGELHEVGLLSFAVEAAAQGWEPVYFGANVPLADLRHATQRVQPDLLALSIVLQHETEELKELLTQLKAAACTGCPVLVGGRALVGFESLVRTTGCLMLPDSGKLIELLTAGPLQTSSRY